MKPQTDKPMIGVTFGIAGTILTIILILLFHPAKSQTIGLGLGYASDGRTTAKLYFVTPSGFGAYVNHYADEKDYIENSHSTGFQYAENPVTCLGITGRIHRQVVVYAGAGWCTPAKPTTMRRDIATTINRKATASKPERLWNYSNTGALLFIWMQALTVQAW